MSLDVMPPMPVDADKLVFYDDFIRKFITNTVRLRPMKVEIEDLVQGFYLHTMSSNFYSQIKSNMDSGKLHEMNLKPYLQNCMRNYLMNVARKRTDAFVWSVYESVLNPYDENVPLGDAFDDLIYQKGLDTNASSYTFFEDVLIDQLRSNVRSYIIRRNPKLHPLVDLWLDGYNARDMSKAAVTIDKRFTPSKCKQKILDMRRMALNRLGITKMGKHNRSKASPSPMYIVKKLGANPFREWKLGGKIYERLYECKEISFDDISLLVVEEGKMSPDIAGIFAKEFVRLGLYAHMFLS